MVVARLFREVSMEECTEELTRVRRLWETVSLPTTEV